MDDLTILQLFVSGGATLEANNNFRVQPTDEARQLFTRDGSLLAAAYDHRLPSTVCLRMGTKYTPALHQTLIDHHYVPVSNIMTNHIVSYEYHPVPSQFSIRCDAARHLWKAWWQDYKKYSRKKEQPLLQILAGGKWRFIDNIVVSRSTLYVTTEDHESVFHGDDKIIWLEEADTEATVCWTKPIHTGDKPSHTLQASEATHSSGTDSIKATSGNNVRIYNLNDPALRFRGNKLYISTPNEDIVLVGEELQKLAYLVLADHAQKHTV